MSINWWIDKQNMLYLHNGMPFNNKEEWNNAKWKKPVTIDHILCDSINMKYLEQANLLSQKVD